MSLKSSADVPEDVLFTLCLSDTGMKKLESTKCREDAVKMDAATGYRVSKWSVIAHLMTHATVIGLKINFPKIVKKQCHCSMTKSSARNVLFMPIQQLYFGRGMRSLTLAQLVGISLIISSPLSKAGQAQLVQKRLHHRHRQITRTDEVKKKPKKGILVIFFRGSVLKKPSQEPQGRSSTEPKVGNCDEQLFVKSKN